MVRRPTNSAFTPSIAANRDGVLDRLPGLELDDGEVAVVRLDIRFKTATVSRGAGGDPRQHWCGSSSPPPCWMRSPLSTLRSPDTPGPSGGSPATTSSRNTSRSSRTLRHATPFGPPARRAAAAVRPRDPFAGCPLRRAVSDHPLFGLRWQPRAVEPPETDPTGVGVLPLSATETGPPRVGRRSALSAVLVWLAPVAERPGSRPSSSSRIGYIGVDVENTDDRNAEFVSRSLAPRHGDSILYRHLLRDLADKFKLQVFSGRVYPRTPIPRGSTPCTSHAGHLEGE